MPALTVRLLGWSLNANADTGPIDPPAGVSVKRWIVNLIAAQKLDADLDVIVDGLRFVVRTRMTLARSGSTLLPSGSATTPLFQMVRSGETPGTSGYRIVLGPLAIGGASPSWDGTSGAFVAQLAGTIVGGTAGPFGAMFQSGKTVQINAEDKNILLEAGLLTAQFPGSRAGGVPTAPALFRSEPDSLSFAAAAKGAEYGFAFSPDHPAMPVWLHSGAAYGPGLIATAPALRVTFDSAKSGDHVLAGLAFTKRGGSLVILETCGILNSWNETERWAIKDELPLALGFDDQGGAWPGPVIAPGAVVKMDRKMPANGDLPVHGGVEGHSYRLQSQQATLVCGTKTAEPYTPPAKFGAGLCTVTTRPWVSFQKANYSFPRIGEGFDGASAQEKSLVFEPGPDQPSGGLPATPPEHWKRGAAAVTAKKPAAIVPTAVDEFRKDLDTSMSGLAIRRVTAVHESGMIDPTPAAGQKITKLFRSADADDYKLRLATHPEIRRIPNPILLITNQVPPAPIAIAATLKEAQNLEYAVLWEKAPWDGAAPPEFNNKQLADALLSKRIDKGFPVAIGGFRDAKGTARQLPWAIGKFGRKLDMDGVFQDIAGHLKGNPAKTALNDRWATIRKTIELVDPAVMRESWVGVIAFDLELDVNDMPQLKAMVPTDSTGGPVIDFVSVAPQPGGGTAWGGVSGAVRWKREARVDYSLSKTTDTEEARFWLRVLDIKWRDGQLVSFRSEASLELRAFLGTGMSVADSKAKPPPTIDILGSAKQRPGTSNSPEYDFTFAADTTSGNPRGLQIYPVTPTKEETVNHIVQEVWFKKVEITAVASKDGGKAVSDARIAIDGDVKFKAPEFLTEAEDFLNGKLVSFFDLGITLPKIDGLNISGLELGYPDLRFDLNLPHVNLLSNALKLKFQDFTVDWHGLLDGATWPTLGLGSLFGGTESLDGKWPRILIGGRLSFGQLPDIFAGSFSDFSLDLLFGLRLDLTRARLADGFGLGVRGFGFEGLNFDLLPFLSLRIKRLDLNKMDDPKGAQLTASEISISILGYQIPYTLDGGFFSSDADEVEDAFFVGVKKIDDTTTGLFDFKYGFVGQNTDFSGAPDVVQGFLEAALMPKADQDPQKPLKPDNYLKTWKPAHKGGPGSGWTFAAEIAALKGLFTGRVLIQDRGFKGLALYLPDGGVLKEWFSDGFGFVGLYYKGATADDDYFHMSMTLPEIKFPTFPMVGGVLAATIWANGGLQLDCGFPWQDGATRRWERTIGLIITPGQGSAGFYVRKTTRETVNGNEITLAAGFAIQWGLGGKWGSGAFTAWARVGIYGVIEGMARFTLGSGFDLQELRVVGAVGVLVEGHAKIDWWVISVEVGVKATAELRMELTYIPHQPILVHLAAELYVSASARACIGGGWVKICKSINVGLAIPVRYDLKL